MAQKNLLFGCFLAFFTVIGSLTAGGDVEMTPAQSGNSLFCDAPAPTDFQVTDRGQNFLTLGWTPAFPGALHTLLVFEMDTIGGWIQIFTHNAVPGNTYTIFNLPPGAYRAQIHTNCASGEASIYYGETFAKIVELTAVAHFPVNPTVMPSCDAIDYPEHEWVGFRVTEIETGRMNLFEYKYAIQKAIINRVFTPTRPIVAADDEGLFPIGSDVVTITGSEFSIFDFKTTPEIPVGVIEIFDASYPVIGICKKSGASWNANYLFEVLSAESTIPPGPPPPQTNGSATNANAFNLAIAERGGLEVTVSSDKTGETLKVGIYTTDGRCVQLVSLVSDNRTINISMDQLAPGFYFATVVSAEQSKTIKFIKHL
ncbi:MAG: T9SS type A sorting domain-containing protein [Saprospiraceae bacterium]|nr:T9SS type A sorting domain-containing protein [Saprospiraceae bacterium]